MNVFGLTEFARRQVVETMLGGTCERSAAGYRFPLAPMLGSWYNICMRIISRKALRLFWEKHPDARQALQAWYADVKHANWRSPADIKNVYRTASFVANNRIVFNIKGNRYRIIVVVQYKYRIVYIRFVGTHQEYECVDATAV